ncbi:MAG: hypothetical protein ABIQ16_19665 [Polyangiaceae bacterium]
MRRRWQLVVTHYSPGVTILSIADYNISPEIAPNSHNVNLGIAYDVKSAGNSEVQRAFEEVRKLPRKQQRKVVGFVVAFVNELKRKAS